METNPFVFLISISSSAAHSEGNLNKNFNVLQLNDDELSHIAKPIDKKLNSSNPYLPFKLVF